MSSTKAKCLSITFNLSVGSDMTVTRRVVNQSLETLFREHINVPATVTDIRDKMVTDTSMTPSLTGLIVLQILKGIF